MIRPMGSVIKSLSKERHKTVYPLCRNGFKVSKTHSHSIENSLLQYACPCKAAAFAWSFYGRDFTASSNLRRRCAQQPTTRMCSGNL